VIFVPINIKVVDYSIYGTYKKIMIKAYDWFTEKTIYNKQTFIQKDGMVNILVSINPSDFDINKDIMFKTYIGNELYSSIRKNIIEWKSIASWNTKSIVSSYWKITTIDNLLLKNKMYSNFDAIDKKIDKYKTWLLSKSNIQNYVILKNGKLDFSVLPFSMNNLACNIKEADLSYIEERLGISIDRTKIVYNSPCKDWMMDLDALLKVVRAYNNDPSLIKNYNP